MIVGQQKKFDEIWEMVKGFKKVMVLGCNTCIAVCHAGGDKEADALASMLKLKAAQDKVPMEISHGAVQRQCENEFFAPVLEDLSKYDLVLSLACGVGVNFLSAKIGNTPVYPGVNTQFFGGVPDPGFFVEMCGGCGNCVLHLTGGICPIVRCSKSLMNGPCGGTNNGKCEVSKDIDCAWFLIVERMKQLGTLERLFEVQPPRDWSGSTHGGPRRVVVEHLRDIEEK